MSSFNSRNHLNNENARDQRSIQFDNNHHFLILADWIKDENAIALDIFIKILFITSILSYRFLAMSAQAMNSTTWIDKTNFDVPFVRDAREYFQIDFHWIFYSRGWMVLLEETKWALSWRDNSSSMKLHMIEIEIELNFRVLLYYFIFSSSHCTLFFTKSEI